jgi:hypothetical protein
MTLKEEVDKVIEDNSHNIEFKTDRIFYLIQKEIDELYPQFDKTEVIFNYGYTVALDKVKEMLQ